MFKLWCERGISVNRGQTQEHAQCTRTRSPAAKISRAKNSIETIAESVLRDKQKLNDTVINLLKWSEVLQTEGFSFNSW